MTAAEKSRYERFLEEEKAAMKSFRVMGKKQLLATGFNLSAANAAFGEGWMDAQPEPRGFR